MKQAIFFVVAIAMSVNIVAAFDCNLVDNKDDCNYLQNSNLTEKDIAIVNLLYKDNFVANHSLVSYWNTGQDINEPPENVNVSSRTFIKGAWVKVLAIMPSVKEGDSLYVPFLAYIMSGNGHYIVLPDNYYSPDYPINSGGDCKRIYSLASDNIQFKVTDDSGIIGTEKYFSATFSEDKTIKAVYDINAVVNVEHYEWQRECCRRDRYGCDRYCDYCRVSYSENLIDSIHLEDSLDVNSYKQNDSVDIKQIDKYNNSTVVLINGSNVNYELNADNANYRKKSYHYSLDYDYKPYFVLQIKADPVEEIESNNIFLDNGSLIFKKPSNCEISYNTFFSTETTPCNLNFTPFNLSITTDKLSYGINDTISVELFPKNTLINVSYGNETVSAINNIEFKAQPLKNRIDATIGHEKAEKTIHVEDKSKWLMLVNLSLFSVFNYFFYVGIKKYWGGLVG